MSNSQKILKNVRFWGTSLVCAAMVAGSLVGALTSYGKQSVLSSSTGSLTETPPPNILFLLDLSTAMNQNCCSGMPCLEQVKRDLLEVRRHNDWARIGVIGTTPTTTTTYFPIAPLNTTPAEFADALSRVTVNPSDTRNFGQALWGVTWSYLRYGIWEGSEEGGDSPITYEDQKTHVITITKALPNDDPLYYDSVAGYIYDSDVGHITGTQNVITHTIEIGGLDKEDTYSNAAKNTKNEGLYLTPVTNQELIAAMSVVLRQIRSEYLVKSAALVNAEDNRVYVTQFALEQDGSMPAGDLLQYETDTDPSSPTFGQILYDEASPYSGARWSAGSLLAARSVSAGEKNSGASRRVFTYVPELLECMPSSRTTARQAETERRMSFDKQLTDDMAGTSCVSLFVQEETYGECPSMSDPPVSEGGSTTKKKEGPVNGVGTGGVCDTVFSTDYRTIDVKCSKTISKIVLDFGGDLTQTFTSSKKQASFTGTGAYAGKKLWGGTITASGTAAVYYANPCFPYSCVDTFEFAGTVRDFTPSTNPDFERYVGNDRGIVRSLLPSDKKPRLDTTEADPSISSELHFNNWYRTVSGKNIEIPVSITLSRYADTNNFVYSNNAFFPIDGQGFGNYGSTGHNYHFTYELHGMFTYTGGETFEFIGDDDVWVYINNRLALDLGGVHGAQTAIIDLDSLRSTLGISVGGTYDIDFYYAERHTTESNFKITTSLVIETPVATEGQDKYLLCHVPPGNPGNAHTIVIAKPAILNAHLRNHDGDHLGPCQPTDLSGDGVVDHKDVQTVVDFVRGVSSASVKYVDMGRGDWKLGSSKRSVPVISRATTHDFSRDRSYRAYKKRLEEKKALGAPDLAVVAANDGMLHAFDIETGEEAWAWVPAQVLYYDQPSTWSGRAIESVWYGQTELFDGSPVIEDLWIDDDGDGQKAEDGSEWHRILIVTQGQGGPATLALDITDSGEPRYLWEILPDTDTVATAQSVSRPLITYVMDTTGEEPTRVPVALWGTGDAAPAYSPADNYAQSEANLIIQALDGSAWGPLGSETAGALINVDPVPGINVDLDGDGRAEQAYIAGAITGIDVNGDEALDVIYFPVSTTYEPLDMGDVDGDGKVGTDDISDPGFTWMYKAVINPADPLNPETCVFLDPLDMTGARPEVYYSATTAWLPSGELAVYWGTGGPENRDATSNGYVFGMVDPNPTGCGETAVPISGFGDQGVITLGAGESLTWDPTVYGGVLYFVTYVPDGPTALSGTSRIYGLEYDTGLPAIDENHDGRDVQSYVSVDGPIGSLTISEQGVMFYGLSTASVLSSGSIAVGSLSLTSVDQIQAQPLSWAEIF